MKHIEVVAAIIVADNKIFSTQRGYGEFKDQWEFPGGKMEPGEGREDALIREIQEELDTTISVDKYLTTVDYDYENFHLTMHCFICSVIEGDLVLKEHESAQWLDKEHVYQVQWLPADKVIIPQLIEEVWGSQNS